MAVLNVKGKDYRVRFTIGFWKRIQMECDISKETLERRLQEDFGNTVQQVLYFGIYYGLPERPATIADMPVTLEDLEDIDTTVMDVIEEALIEGMTKAERETMEKVKAKRSQMLEDLVSSSGDVKKN